jgi:MinD superfamily P-loop ATPase
MPTLLDIIREDFFDKIRLLNLDVDIPTLRILFDQSVKETNEIVDKKNVSSALKKVYESTLGLDS